MDRLWTRNKSLEIKGVNHALQGDGPGNKGLYAVGRTWCQCKIGKQASENNRRSNCSTCATEKKFWIAKFRKLAVIRKLRRSKERQNVQV